MAFMIMQMMHLYRPSLHLTFKSQTPWIRRSAIRRFLNSSGPVRYIPRVRKQNPARRQDEHTNRCLDLSKDDEGTSAHAHKVLSETQQGIANVRQKAEAHARSGSCSNEENDFCIASIQLSRESSHQRKTSSSELLAAEMSTQHMPASLQHCLSRGDSWDSSYYLSENKVRGEPSIEEQGIEPPHVETQNIAGFKAKSARQLQTSSSYPAMPTLPTNVIQVGNRNVDNFENIGQRRGKELLSVREGWKDFLQAPKESPSFSVQEIQDKKIEAGSKGRSPLPGQDAESFLLKIQRAKQRSLESCEMPHNAALENSSLDGNNEIDEDGFLLFEQDTLEQTEDVQGASTLLDLHSMAEQEHAKNQAVRYLSMRPYTAAQLKKKLLDKRIAPELADYAVSSLQSCGLQNDLAYAETFSTARFNHGGWGPQRIKLGLKQRGISDEIIKAAINRVFCEEEEVAEMEQDEDAVRRASVLKLSKAAMDHLLVQATKQWKRGRDASVHTKTRRMVCWLQYRGFNYGVIKHVLKHLQKDTSMEDEH